MVVQNIEQERISRLEGTYEQVDRRLDDMNTRLGETNRRLADTPSPPDHSGTVARNARISAAVSSGRSSGRK